MGPLSGIHGGEIVYEGSFKNLKTSNGKTGEYFSDKRTFKLHPRKWTEFFEIKNASLYNLNKISVKFPKDILTVITGVAGSGKSTLVGKVLPSQFPEVIIIDQSTIVGNSRANLLTYLDISNEIRDLFATSNKVSNKLFSRNSEGACPFCKGLGIEKIDMAFMDDVEEPCEACHGSGFRNEVLQYSYQKKNIVQVMNMTVEEAAVFFMNQVFSHHFNLLIELGLGYVTLGQRLSTFSGGERQRLKLTTELNGEGKVLILDEPTTGLHPADTKRLMAILNRMVESGNTLIVIEHNLDIISQADWVIDIGPGPGKYGGQLVFEGTVKRLMEDKVSATAKYLRRHVHGISK